MQAFERFGYSSEPFPAEGEGHFNNGRGVGKIIERAVLVARFRPGAMLIFGKEGVGKTEALSRIAERLANGSLVIQINAAHTGDIVRAISESLGMGKRKAGADDILAFALDEYAHGKNVFFLVDDIDRLEDSELAGLAFFTQKIPNSRLIATVREHRVVKKLKKSRVIVDILEKFNIRRLSFFGGIYYVREQSEESLSLSSTKNPISLGAAVVLSLCANRNIRNLNKLASETLGVAAKEGLPRAGIKSAITAAGRHKKVARENLYFKAQKTFIYLMFAISAYFVLKMFSDRHWFIQELEVRDSIKEQEAKLG
ncbi:MAG: ATP-binding protein [Rickettsiales bacterium]|jgi:hypothetical protein|nr:ATP-binding protein [Rickettsiales bacterium]